MADAPNRSQQWTRWLEQALAAAGMTGAQLSAASGGRIGATHLTYWTTGQAPADPDDAVEVAALLGADPAAALQAAGYPDAADALRLAEGQQPQADTATGDPVFTAIIAAGFDTKTRTELIGARAMDLYRLEKARAAAQEIALMRVAQRRRDAGL